MNDSTTPDPAEQERRERIPSLQGNTPIINPTVEELLARAQAGRRRNRTITTVEQEEDDSYTVTFRYLTNNEAARTILASRRVRSLSPASKRALWTLERTPLVLKRRRKKTGRKPNITAASAPKWVERIRQAVAAADVFPATYETASEHMRPSPLQLDQFGKYVRKLSDLGYGPWPSFFEKQE